MSAPDPFTTPGTSSDNTRRGALARVYALLLECAVRVNDDPGTAEGATDETKPAHTEENRQ